MLIDVLIMITQVKAYEVDGVIRRNVITPIQELIPNNRERAFGGSGHSGLHDRWWNQQRETQNKFVTRIYNPLKLLLKETIVRLVTERTQPRIEPPKKKKK